jgi:uracil-DNA glycosylase family 4
MIVAARGVASTAIPPAEPALDCALCPRLVAYRAANQTAEPAWHNAPVHSFGDPAARVLIVGLAPGLRGANRTGRPFTGDYAGDLLYATLLEFGLAKGSYLARADDGLTLNDCMVTNAVRCAPPENKPLPAELRACQTYLTPRIHSLGQLAAIVALGRIAHDSVLAALGLRRSTYPFAHGARHELSSGVALFDSFHCSRYNTNTGKLTADMFRAVFQAVQRELARA